MPVRGGVWVAGHDVPRPGRAVDGRVEPLAYKFSGKLRNRFFVDASLESKEIRRSRARRAMARTEAKLQRVLRSMDADAAVIQRMEDTLDDEQRRDVDAVSVVFGAVVLQSGWRTHIARRNVNKRRESKAIRVLERTFWRYVGVKRRYVAAAKIQTGLARKYLAGKVVRRLINMRDVAIGLQAQWRGIKSRAKIREMRLIRIVAEQYVDQVCLFAQARLYQRQILPQIAAGVIQRKYHRYLERKQALERAAKKPRPSAVRQRYNQQQQLQSTNVWVRHRASMAKSMETLVAKEERLRLSARRSMTSTGGSRLLQRTAIQSLTFVRRASQANSAQTPVQSSLYSFSNPDGPATSKQKPLLDDALVAPGDTLSPLANERRMPAFERPSRPKLKPKVDTGQIPLAPGIVSRAAPPRVRNDAERSEAGRRYLWSPVHRASEVRSARSPLCFPRSREVWDRPLSPRSSTLDRGEHFVSRAGAAAVGDGRRAGQGGAHAAADAVDDPRDADHVDAAPVDRHDAEAQGGRGRREEGGGRHKTEAAKAQDVHLPGQRGGPRVDARRPGAARVADVDDQGAPRRGPGDAAVRARVAAALQATAAAVRRRRVLRPPLRRRARVARDAAQGQARRVARGGRGAADGHARDGAAPQPVSRKPRGFPFFFDFGGPYLGQFGSDSATSWTVDHLCTSSRDLDTNIARIDSYKVMLKRS